MIIAQRRPYPIAPSKSAVAILTSFHRRYPMLWPQVDIMCARRGKDLAAWTDDCFLSFRHTRTLLSQACGVPDTGHPIRLAAEAQVLMMLVAWRVTQGVYRFDPILYEALITTPITRELPTDLLCRLPEWCVYLELQGLPGVDRSTYGVFARVSDEQGKPLLRLMTVTDQGTPVLPLPLGRTLDEALAETDARSRAMGSSTEDDLSSEAVAGVISLLLYLCSEKPDLGRDGLVPTRPEPVKTRKGLRWFIA